MSSGKKSGADQGARERPPVIDVHTHFFPQPMFNAIWKFFKDRAWPVNHQTDVEQMPEILAAHGVVNFTTLNYVRRPGQAESLNAWTRDFIFRHPEAVPFCTFHAADPDPWQTARPLLAEHGFAGVKLQPVVSEFGVDDPRIARALDGLFELDKILVVHCGSAPRTSPWVGLDRFERMMEQRPLLKVILPHLGAFEAGRAFALLDKYPNLYLDTAMIFTRTDAFETQPDVGMEEIERRADRILFGSDYPNLPYSYEEALDSIMRLPISEGARRKIMYENAAGLLGVDAGSWRGPIEAGGSGGGHV